MRRHAKASTAGTNQGRATGLGCTFRGALALRGLSSEADGRGAPAHALPRSRRVAPVVLASLLALLLLACVAPAAQATSYQRPFLEEFSTTEQPTFAKAEALAVDKATGDVLVQTEASFSLNGKIYRQHADGTPAPFAALGGNLIDGKAGPGGKPCAEEPASCDQTPENGFAFGYGTEITIDNSGGSTDGNIYVPNRERDVVDIFSSEGRYLGELTAAGFEPLSSPCTAAVNGAGEVFVGAGRKVEKFVPTGNPPVNTDHTATFERADVREELCGLAVGEGSSAGWIFAGYIGREPEFSRKVAKFNEETGESSRFVEGHLGPIAVDPTTGNLLAFREVDNPLESGTFGSKQLEEFSGAGETAGPVLSKLNLETGANRIEGFAVNSGGNVYASQTGASTHLLVYGHPAVVPTVEVNLAANVAGKSAVLTGVVNPSGVEVTECSFEYVKVRPNGFPEGAWEPVPCEGALPTDSSDHAVHANVSGLAPNGQEYAVRLAAENENGIERSTPKTFVTARTVATDAASEISRTAATLNGTVLPEGLEYNECYFEWGLDTSPGFAHKAPCYPPAAAIEPGAASQSVSAALTGLEPSAVYRFRLVATNSEGTQIGEDVTFMTLGVPQFTNVRARDAGQSEVTLEASINPSGSMTSYHFEWGTGTSYGNHVPASFDPVIGSGTDPIRVSVKVTGLAPSSVYHYRVVATNAAGTAGSDDREAETLNACGLPNGRCFELVSPSDAGPVAVPGEHQVGAEMVKQAAPSGPGALAYMIESGLPEATSGAEVLYLGRRSASGWSYPTQLKPPINAADEKYGGGSGSGEVAALNDDLSCGVVESFMPLTDDPGALENRENGGSSLYRRDNSNGTYRILTKLPPENGLITSYRVLGLSQDCNTVAFDTKAIYPGISGEGGTRLYEWDDGTLRNLAVVPGPSGEVPTAASQPGGPRNVVSADGSRVFFQATRKTSPNASEIGKQGVFVREDGEVTRDLSLSETATADSGATFRWATPDGSRVFFTANAGLTAEGSPSGTDLYEYDLDSEALTDLSLAEEEGPAEVTAFAGGSDGGSRIYFLAQGKLVPGKRRGASLAENQTKGTASLYSEENGVLSFVATVGSSEKIQISGSGTSRVTPDGRYLAFQSSKNVTGYDSQGAPEAYLYDAADGSDGTICVSCRPDGLPPAGGAAALAPLRNNAHNPLHPLNVIAESGGRPQVFFVSESALAPGTVENQPNLYEWAHGQVFRVESELPGQIELTGQSNLDLYGVSADGSDVYFSSRRTLTWEDGDERASVYDARVGGGFPEPPPPPTPCDADSEGSCQSSRSQGGSSSPAASNSFNGPGNVKESAGGGGNRCTRSARQAKSLSTRAKRLTRNARKVNRKSHRRAVRLNRKAHRLAQRAKGLSTQAKRCRKRQRANNDRRAGK